MAGSRIGRPRGARSGFSLVEGLLVLLVLGVLAALAVPHIAAGDTQREAVAESLTRDIRIVRERVSMHHSQASTYPSQIDATWFASGTVPNHPSNQYGLATVEVVSQAGVLEPSSKVLTRGVAGAYWYNAAEGVFSARVVDMGSEAATLDFYNRVNGTTVTSLGNYGSD